jgi:hypothetical protein
MTPASRAAHAVLGVLGTLFLGLTVVFGYFGWSAQQTRFEVTGTGLRIIGAYGRSLPGAELDVSGARRVGFGQEPGLAPQARTNGIGVPGYLAGWARLRGGEKALVFLTDPSRVVMIPTTGDYLILASVAEPDAFLAALGSPQSSSTFPMAPAGGSAVPFMIGAGLLTLAAAGLMAFLSFDCRRIRYEVGPAGLRIVGMYGRMIPIASLQRDQARSADLSLEPTLRPILRTNGTGLPGFLAGWVRLGGGVKALVFLTDPQHVVHVPTRDGYALLLSVETPERFVEALRGV